MSIVTLRLPEVKYSESNVLDAVHIVEAKSFNAGEG